MITITIASDNVISSVLYRFNCHYCCMSFVVVVVCFFFGVYLRANRGQPPLPPQKKNLKILYGYGTIAAK